MAAIERPRNARPRAPVVRQRGGHRRVRRPCSRSSRAARSPPTSGAAFRLLRGTYGQRQTDDAQMMRVKIPQGILDRRAAATRSPTSPSATRAASATSPRARTSSSISSSCTTPNRRCAQLAEAGMTTREACGNSVRNITACPYAGVAADEPFDVTPYAEALTRYLLRHPLSSSLPRKFKIAFEGCAEDHIKRGDQRHRLARARRSTDGGQRGFRVIVGRRHGDDDASRQRAVRVPAGRGDVRRRRRRSSACSTRLGDYKHKQRNRMKFLIKSLGWDRWRAEFETSAGRRPRRGRRAAAVRSRAAARSKSRRRAWSRSAVARRDRSRARDQRRVVGRASCRRSQPRLAATDAGRFVDWSRDERARSRSRRAMSWSSSRRCLWAI